MKSKVLKIILIYLIIKFVYFQLCPYLLGSQIDRELLENIDTERLTVQCDMAKILVDYDDKNMKTAIFAKYDKNVYVLINIDIFDENIYASKSKVIKTWYGIKHPLEFDTVINMRKNNIQITIYDFNKDMRSRDAEIFLKEVFTELGV